MACVSQEAQKFARHAKRTYLTPEDVNLALKMRNVQPIYGLSSSTDPARFVKAAGFEDVFYAKDPVLKMEDALETPLEPQPWDAGLRIHWLAVDGVQPVIPENAPFLPANHRLKRRRTDYEPPRTTTQGLAAKSTPAAAKAVSKVGDDIGSGSNVAGNAKMQDQSVGGIALENETLVRAPLKHVLTRELNMYYDKLSAVMKDPFLVSKKSLVHTEPKEITERSVEISVACKAVLSSLRIDAGLQPLVPYICQFIANEIADSIANVPKLEVLLRAIQAFSSNPNVDLGQYLHMVIPAVLTCLLAKHIGSPSRSIANFSGKDFILSLESPHWEVREHAAGAIASICAMYPEIAPRVQRQILSAMTSPRASLQTIYGSIVGIQQQGPRAVKTLLLPNLIPCMHVLREDLEGRRGWIRFIAALKVRNALLDAAGYCVFMSGLCSLPKIKYKNGSSPAEKEEKMVHDKKSKSIFERVKKQLAKPMPGVNGNINGRSKNIKTKEIKKVMQGKTVLSPIEDLFSKGFDNENERKLVAEKAAESMELVPAGVLHHVNITDESWLKQGKYVLNDSMIADLPETNVLEDAWREDFSFEVLRRVVSNVFGDDIMPYQKEQSDDGELAPTMVFI